MRAIDRNLKQIILREVQESFGLEQPPEALLERIEAAWLAYDDGYVLEAHHGWIQANVLETARDKAGACGCPKGPKGTQGEPGKGSLNPLYRSEPRENNTWSSLRIPS